MLRRFVSIQPLQQSTQPRRPLRNAICSALMLGIAAVWTAPVSAASTKIAAPDGSFEGKFDTTGGMLEFLGIRYAQAVTGELRWKPPQPLKPMIATQDATQFGNHCPQPASPFGNGTVTEDCLLDRKSVV